ncbi:MAG: (2Fe-2S)-binding protein [Peptococcaceae bacterium]|jgi:bacterioferritin-associated ferredoxin|nr:(2Fe-2S)-binding protein [Peptococcaceae bacterium]
MKKEKMVCHCRHITIGDIEQAVSQGVADFSQLQAMTGVAQSCRRCREYAENIFIAVLKDYEQNQEKEPRLF